MNRQNPNNCETCRWKQLRENDDGWCYMFRDEPTEKCMQHSGRELLDVPRFLRKFED